MTTQEKLEAFSPYLPYGVHYITNNGDNFELISIDVGVEVANVRRNGQFYIDEIKPILRPISDLTKPCLEGFKVPIVELAKIAYPDEEWSLDAHNNCVGAKDKYIFAYEYNEYSFTLDTITDYAAPLSQLQLFQQLYKWHFWLGDQSEFGKSIIDINTIKTE